MEALVSNSLVVTGPGPPRKFAQWMKLVLGLRMDVLHRDLRTEFNVRSDRLAELFIVGKVRRIYRRHTELGEPDPLLLGNPKVSVNVDEMCEAELSGEAVGTTEGFNGEGGEVIACSGVQTPKSGWS